MGTKAVDVDIESVGIGSFETGTKGPIGTTTPSATQLTTTNYAKKGVRIKALSTNPATIYVGKVGVTIGPGGGPTDGYPLAAGEQIDLPIQNPSTIYLLAGAGSCSASYVLI